MHNASWPQKISILILLLAVGVIAGCIKKSTTAVLPIVNSGYIQANINQATATPPSDNSLIRLDAPTPNSLISSPVHISGQAKGNWYFEAVFPVRIVDSDNVELGSGQARAQGDWTTEQFVPFTADVIFKPTAKTNGFIVLEKDNPSGLSAHAASVRIPIQFIPANQTVVRVYFGNTQQNPNAQDCNTVFPVSRIISKTAAIGQAALTELLQGPTAAELQNGYFTSINSGVAIQKLTITNGVATVDFNNALERAVGGSCRVQAIRAQITQTLLQFPTVSRVIIAINGRTQDILQP